MCSNLSMAGAVLVKNKYCIGDLMVNRINRMLASAIMTHGVQSDTMFHGIHMVLTIPFQLFPESFRNAVFFFNHIGISFHANRDIRLQRGQDRREHSSKIRKKRVNL